MRAAFVALIGLVLLVPAASAQEDYGRDCLTADPPPVTKPAQPLRFGITPGAAGSVGTGQATVVPEDPDRALAELRDLRAPGKTLVMRLNRLFWADGDEGIRRFAALTDRYGAAGFEVESQVRYHPPEGQEGNIPAWEAYVRSVARELGKRPALSALSITNEANFSGSRNTSDGAYKGVVDALVRGIVVAREELDAMGRQDVKLGFSMMWRFRPDTDRRFWEDIGAKSTPAFREAVDYVGLQVYPGLVWPPAPRPGVSAGAEVIEALTLLRRCYMPKAAFGDDVAVWVSENGYATNAGRSEASQRDSLDSTLRDLHRWSGELGITDYRWFNLRDNDSDGADLFAAVGLLRDDYTRKPAFATFRNLAGELGAAERRPAAERPRPEPRRPRTRARRRLIVRSKRHGRRTIITRGRLRGFACRGSVAMHIRSGRRTIAGRRVPVGRTCRFAARVRFAAAPRNVRVTVRRGAVSASRRVADPPPRPSFAG